MAKLKPADIVKYAELYRDKKDERIYEYFKTQLKRFVMSQIEYKYYEKQVADILGIKI